jgi:hypothetical protein
MKKILLTRVVPSSSERNERGFHVLNEDFKIFKDHGSGLLYCSYKKIPKSFIIMEITNDLYDMLLVNPSKWHKRHPSYQTKDRALGFSILKQELLKEHGVKKEKKCITHACQ